MRFRWRSWISALACAVAIFCAQAWAGVVYTVTSTTKQDATEAVMRVRMSVEGESARIDILEGAVGPLHAGTYLVTRDGGKTLYVVDPEMKAYGLLDPEAMMGEPIAKMAESAQVSTTEPKLERVSDEQGPTMFGMSTRHGKFKTSYTMTVKLVHSYSSSIVSEDEVWWTDKLQDASVRRWSLEDVLPTQPDAPALLKLERDKKIGFPLKRTITTRAEEPDGKVTSSTTSMEVTELKIAPVADKAFEIPKNFRKIKLHGE